MLFSAGLLASHGLFNVWALVALLCCAAIAGDSVGYWFGARVGQALFTRTDSFFFQKKHLDRVRSYYQTFGAKTIVIARFVPVIRTFAPILAGVASMPYRTFLRYNILGGLLWSAGVTLLGYGLGNAFPQTEHYLLPIILCIVVASVLPVVWEWYRERYPHSTN